MGGRDEYRKEAYWALGKFPNSHRGHEAFAAGFGQALARLLSLPLVVTLSGTPGDSGVLNLVRAALTGLRHGNLVLRYREEPEAALTLAQQRVSEAMAYRRAN